MHKNILTETLTDLGLSENESAVYFSALSLGPTTILKVAKSAEIKRTTVYSVIESLQSKGLVRIELKGFKKLYVAEGPEKLESILEQRKAKLKQFMPELAALYNLKGGESFLKYHEGLEAVKNVYESLIKDVRPHEDYLVMANQDQWLSLDPDYFRDFLVRRAKLPIKVRMMFQDTELGRKWQAERHVLNTKIRMLPESTKLTTNLVVTPQRVLIHQLIPPVFGIVIENRSIIRMHQEMYDIIWKSLSE
ncbi:MAG: helix-turn-helix domain-containing protein [Patescibacteria group bacterium]